MPVFPLNIAAAVPVCRADFAVEGEILSLTGALFNFRFL